jgi:glycosyltransferase involved in cell wall biosynthesis
LTEKRPFFTIITVCYNNAETLPQTIESVLNQSFTDFEYWIIDGQSNDGCQEIIQSFGEKISSVSEPDSGIYDAMNKGIGLAKGEFIAFLNADDFYADRDVLNQVFQSLEKEKNAWAAYGDLAYVDGKNPDKIIRYWQSGRYTPESFLWGWMPPHPTFFLRKEAFEKFGLFRNEALKSAADYELILRMLFKNKLQAVYCRKLLVRMRVGGLSNQSFGNRLRGNQEDRLAWNLNQIRPYWFTLILKPLRKLIQYFQRP